MAYAPLSLNMEYFNDPTTSKPVFNGSVWIGEPDKDPEIEANRVSVIITQEDGTTVTIDPDAQPLTTGANGRIQFPASSGKSVVIKVDGEYSIKVRNNLDKQIYYAPRANEVDSVPSDTGVNVLNGSFEIETITGISDNWTFAPFVNGSVAPDSTSQAHGLKSLKFIGVDANGGGISTSDRFSAAENNDLDVGFIYKSSNAATLNKVDVKFYNAAGAPVSTVTAYTNGTTNPTAYTHYLRRITIPSGGIEAEVIITGLDPLGTITIGNSNFDDIHVSESNPVIESVNVDNAVNRVSISDAVTGANPTVRSDGEANTGLIIADSNDNEIIIAESVADAVNEITVTNAATGNKPSINNTGEDVGLDIEGVELKNSNVETTTLNGEAPQSFISIVNPTTQSINTISTWNSYSLIDLSGVNATAAIIEFFLYGQRSGGDTKYYARAVGSTDAMDNSSMVVVHYDTAGVSNYSSLMKTTRSMKITSGQVQMADTGAVVNIDVKVLGYWRDS